MDNHKKASRVLTCIGACYRISHEAICEALADEAPHLLEIYHEPNPIGSFIITGNDGVEFVPKATGSDVWEKMAQPDFRLKVREIATIILHKLPEFLMREGLERDRYYQNLAKFKDSIFALMVDIETLRAEGLYEGGFGNRFAHEPIKDAARFIGVLSDEYGIKDQAIAFNDESAVRFELVSREEVGLGRNTGGMFNNGNETIH